MDSDALEFAKENREKVFKRISDYPTCIWWSIFPLNNSMKDLTIKTSGPRPCYGDLYSAAHSLRNSVASIDLPTRFLFKKDALVTIKSEGVLAFTDYVINESPFSSIILDTDPETVLQKGAIKETTTAPTQIWVGAGQILRNIWENPSIFQTWNHLNKVTKNKHLSFVLSYFLGFCAPGFFVIKNSNFLPHSLMDNGWIGSALKNVLNNNINVWQFWMEHDDPNLRKFGTPSEGGTLDGLARPWMDPDEGQCYPLSLTNRAIDKQKKLNTLRSEFFKRIEGVKDAPSKTVWGIPINPVSQITDIDKFLASAEEVINGFKVPWKESVHCWQ